MFRVVIVVFFSGFRYIYFVILIVIVVIYIYKCFIFFEKIRLLKYIYKCKLVIIFNLCIVGLELIYDNYFDNYFLWIRSCLYIFYRINDINVYEYRFVMNIYICIKWVIFIVWYEVNWLEKKWLKYFWFWFKIWILKDICVL